MPHTQARLRRSVLYVPAVNLRAIEKARRLDADVVILDLEDSVAPTAKRAARENVVAEIRKGGFGRSELVVRINSLDTPWGKDDLDAVIELEPDGVLVPKVSGPEDLSRVQNEIKENCRLQIWAMLETPRAILQALEIAQARPDSTNRLSALVMGTNDLAKETRAVLTPGRVAFLPWLMQCIAAARIAGITILDGVYNDFSDPMGFAAECLQAREIGMDGKTLIHPSQIQKANHIFSPNPQEVAWAIQVCDAFDDPRNESTAVLTIDGRMVERLHAEDARRVLTLARATGVL